MAERSTSSTRSNRAARSATAVRSAAAAHSAAAARSTTAVRSTAAARLSAPRLTHLDEANRPTMVDVGPKEVTHRIAVAEARIKMPRNVAAALRKSGHRTKKGPVFDTAIVAGVMAAKKTHELIPFCHPLGLDNCSVEVEDEGTAGIVIRCRVSIHHRTGVEMEALTGAAVAALTIYDMCKALSHDIEIDSVRLLEKTGGKRAFKR
jgi:cyclic pyranopterin monophosphate synthase